ncbi:MAG: tetratricopeptide repeat protein, partial [Acidobacteriota bacterium]
LAGIVMTRLALQESLAQNNRAEKILETMTDAIEEANPDRALGVEVTMRQVIEQRESRVTERSIEVPLDRASIREGLGAFQFAQGELDAAERSFGQALEIYRERLPSGHAIVAGVLDELAEVHYGQGRYAAAESLLLEALPILRRRYGEASPRVAECLGDLAALAEVQGRFAKAQEGYTRALRLFGQAEAQETRGFALVLSNFGVLLARLGDLEGAERELKRSLEIRLRVLGPNHLDTADTFSNLAWVSAELGRRDEAESLLAKASAIQRLHLRSDHTKVGETRRGLGIAQGGAGKLEEAQSELREALEIELERSELAGLVSDLGDVLVRAKKVEDAIGLYRLALEIRRLLPGKKRERAIAQVRLAKALTGREPIEAIALYRQTLAMDGVEDVGQEVERTLLELRLGRLLLEQGQIEEAEALARSSWLARLERDGPDASSTARSRLLLEECLRSLEASASGEPPSRRAAPREERPAEESPPRGLREP